VALLHHLLHPIATAIDRIARDPDAPRVLDFQEPVFTGEAVALFGDLTNSSQVLGRLTATEAATMLDEYIERLCDVGLRFGGSIDRYLGDGFFLRFNAPQPVTHYGAAAVECALAMQDEFTELTGEWESLFPSCEETSPCHQQGHWQSLSAEALRQASTPSSQPPRLRRSTRGSRSSACRTGSSG
jgi:hypothetical protein